MDFSIVIPAYKAKATITRAVASVLKQTLLPKEILIVADDGQDYISHLAKTGIESSLICSVTTDSIGSGPGNARNIGIQASHYNAVAFLDADDCYHKTRLEVLAPLLKQFGAALTGLYIIDDATGMECEIINAPHYQRSINAKNLFRVAMHGMGHIAFNKQRLPLLFDQHYNLEDIVFGYSIFNIIDEIGYSNEALYGYYRRDGSLCNSPETGIAVLNAITHLLDAKHPKIPGYHAASDLYKHLRWIEQAEHTWMQRKDKQKSFQDFFVELARPHEIS